MKTIKILKVLINILYVILIAVLVLGLVFFIASFFLNEYLPFSLRGFNRMFSVFNGALIIGPLLKTVNFILFLFSVFYLRKCIKPFIESDYYSETVIKNLRRAGNIFVFIGGATILIQFIMSFLLLRVASNIVEGLSMNSLLMFLSSSVQSLDVENIFLVVIGLFFLLFSKATANAKDLKQENDLTI